MCRLDPDWRYCATLFTTLPEMKPFRLEVRVSIRRIRAAWLAQAMCGVMWQFRAESSGLSCAGGSVESTSTAAAAILPLLSASARSCSHTNGPRPVLMTIAEGFMVASRSAFTRCLVSGVRGQCSESTSLDAKSWSRGIFVIPSASASWGFEVKAATFMPSASAIFATAEPV